MAITANAKHTLPLLCADEYLQPRRPVLPHVSPAGERSSQRSTKTANADTTAICLSFTERPQTPPHEKKYRQSALHEPGAIVRHFGTAEDPLPEGTFGRATHAKPGETVAEYIQSYPKSALKQWALQQAEDVYARYTGDLCYTLCFTIGVKPGLTCFVHTAPSSSLWARAMFVATRSLRAWAHSYLLAPQSMQRYSFPSHATSLTHKQPAHGPGCGCSCEPFLFVTETSGCVAYEAVPALAPSTTF